MPSTTVVSFITAVGGHFLNGNRRKGYGYFLALVAWPFVFFFLQVGLLLVGIEHLGNSRSGGLVFLLGLAAIWAISVFQSLKDARHGNREQGGNIGKRWPEIVLLSVLLYATVAYGVLGFVIAPHLKPGDRLPLFETSSPVRGRPAGSLPAGNGDLLLAGELLHADGRPFGNAQILFLFQDGYRSPEVATDSQGKFEYRMPPGEWRFMGPLVTGYETHSVSVTFTPDMMRPTFQVTTGNHKATVRLRIVVQ
jgi:hypothetical protein